MCIQPRTEPENALGHSFGEHKLEQVVHNNQSRSPSELLDQLLRDSPMATGFHGPEGRHHAHRHRCDLVMVTAGWRPHETAMMRPDNLPGRLPTRKLARNGVRDHKLLNE